MDNNLVDKTLSTQTNPCSECSHKELLLDIINNIITRHSFISILAATSGIAVLHPVPVER